MEPNLTMRILLVASLAASPVAAQAICSAPHSSPTLAGGGTIGTLAPRAGWIMVSALRQSTTEIFNTLGDRQALLADGQFATTSAYLSAGVGVARGLDLWAQVPFHAMRYRDTGGARSRDGIGDVRAAVRVSPQLFGRAWPLAVRAGIKVPGSTFPVDATIIPLTEGQRDAELSVETGRALGHGVYALGWVGYRWRSENVDARRDPGDERFAHVASGITWRGLRFELGADYLSGLPPRQLGFEVPASRRRMLQFSPTLGREVGRGTLEFTSVLPSVGRNLPTGAGFSLGYRVGWAAPRPALPKGTFFGTEKP